MSLVRYHFSTPRWNIQTNPKRQIGKIRAPAPPPVSSGNSMVSGMARLLWVFLVLAGLLYAQDEGGGTGETKEGDDGDVEIQIGGEGAEDGTIDIAIDPFDRQVAPAQEPNRPPPIKIGEWQPPVLDLTDRRALEKLLERRSAQPDDVGLRYRLAEYYLEHRWFPRAEAEFLGCAQQDPDSIRPWDGLLRVYAERPKELDQNEIVRRLVAQGGVINWEDVNAQQERDWLSGDLERNRRITRAYEEIVKRRPDDVARRRAFIEHLKIVPDYERLLEQTRAILARMPGDTETRFEMAEALRRSASAKGKEAGAAEMAEALRLLEENHERAPDHAATALRLARMIAVRDGAKAQERIIELERRGAFRLFVLKDIADVQYREDTFRMMRDLCGPRIATTLWDDLFEPEWYRQRRRNPFGPDGEEVSGYRRWIFLYFPHAQARERLAVIERLRRRADRDAAGILLAFLWHFQPAGWFREAGIEEQAQPRKVEQAAVRAVASLGAVVYPMAERFLRAADTEARRRRGVHLLRALHDPRAVQPLLEALAWDVGDQEGFGVAGGLEELADPQAIDGLVEAALDVRRPLPRRLEAAEALAVFRDARSIEALRRLNKEQGFGLVTTYGLFRLTSAKTHLDALQKALNGDYPAADVVRLLRKCDDPRLEELLIDGLKNAPEAARPVVLGLLRERYRETSRDRVKAILLKWAEAPGVPDYAIKVLGEIGGTDVADRLLPLVEQLDDDVKWATTARALAKTGDPRAVRYFNRMRILEKDPGRRRLAEDLHVVAAKRQAEIARQSR